ncbi:hypothetical protein BJY16_007596 [Actinoplanes octamycinicus]|uniref:Uncharacterized protein n=1 Tax=Actinoplanes octamycinicus TaxID=135948 RepID=A0A7W7MBK2_9ACTN|nr:hypothetical protein [Actinoplanes octamycinicus]MBB4744137.1 hypothetical protein [Actinoplanes octamycinicus]GIE56907.1 hypothetical protein Aoc01nite_23090 [Actinoplanes octamycinicus]
MDGEMAVRQLRLIAIDRLVGCEVGSDKLIRAGVDALLAGVASPSLPMLAGLTRREEPEARSVFDRVADELGLVPEELPAEPTARTWALVRWWAELIVNGELTAEEGGRLIWRHGRPFLGSSEELRPLMESIVLHDDEMSSWSIWDAEYVSRNRATAAAVIAQAQAFLSATR